MQVNSKKAILKEDVLKDLNYIIDDVDSLLVDLKNLQASLEEWL